MKRTKYTIYKMPVFVEKDDKWFSAFCPSLQGCYAQGKTLEEAIKNIRDVIKLHIKDKIAEKETIQTHNLVSLTTLEVAV